VHSTRFSERRHFRSAGRPNGAFSTEWPIKRGLAVEMTLRGRDDGAFLPQRFRPPSELGNPQRTRLSTFPQRRRLPLSNRDKLLNPRQSYISTDSRAEPIISFARPTLEERRRPLQRNSMTHYTSIRTSTRKSFCDQGLQIRTVDHAFLFFMWLEDSEQAAFSFQNTGEREREISTRTRDANLISPMHQIFIRTGNTDSKPFCSADSKHPETVAE
jgi:hypothetical protein